LGEPAMRRRQQTDGSRAAEAGQLSARTRCSCKPDRFHFRNG
jgi:hypothetical protein